MEITLDINTQFKVNGLEDLPRLGQVMKQMKIKINKSQLARDLGKNRKTIEKYLNGFIPKVKRDKPSKIDDYYPVIASLLSDESPQTVYYMRVLWQYLGLRCSQSTFRAYINQHEEFEAYFKSNITLKSPKGTSRFETPPGKQAQLDWKENIDFLTSDGEKVTVNVAVLILAHSRFRFFHLSLTKTQDALFSFLTQTFEKMDGVPKQIVTDNMKTVMDEARTEYSKGKINARFTQFIENLCNRVNQTIHQGTGKVPLLEFQNEARGLAPLPNETIRATYKINHHEVKVNASNMVNYQANQYFVPPGYVGKKVEIQALEGQLWVSYQGRVIAQHALSQKKLNYHIDHYKATLSHSTGKHFNIDALAQKNLETISEVFKR